MPSALAELDRKDQAAPAPLSTVGGEGGWGVRTSSASQSHPAKNSPRESLPAQGSQADRTYGRRRAFWLWDALVRPHPPPLPSEAGEPALSLSKRGDQSRARGRSNAAQATLARMFCPPLNPAGRGLGKPGFPVCSPQPSIQSAMPPLRQISMAVLSIYWQATPGT